MPDPGRDDDLKAQAWARVYAAIRPPQSRNLRAGAWYPVVNDELPDRVTLRIGKTVVTVPRRVVEVRPRQPKRFSVVHRVGYVPVGQRKSLHHLGRYYAVCPICHWRFGLIGTPERTRCRQCGHDGEVSWWETV
jgi:hypothetical protein